MRYCNRGYACARRVEQGADLWARGYAGVTRAYMGQTQIWPRIGPISVPRPRTGSIFGEPDTRKPIWGVPGPLGAKLGDFFVGPMYTIWDNYSIHGPPTPRPPNHPIWLPTAPGPQKSASSCPFHQKWTRSEVGGPKSDRFAAIFGLGPCML